MASPKNPTVFYGAIIVAIVAIVLCVYYLVPGVFHILVLHGDPMASHTTHAIGMAAIAVLAIIGALVTRPKSAAR